ncbi:YdcF family protein [Pedobacter sp. KBW06]|uniref:YdcF family protein n=1 Tax=Pedobacter sp. KBW06 TaxID=2153359 RepID=UPI000F5995BC|nr:YdcF family protein [Pedobacter sp. KBW06]RQO69970.1 YdcF family protein [Pedobacter sp. KBW06]
MEPDELHREILKTPHCPVMDPQLISVLTDLCFQKEDIIPSDLLFVFGSNVKHKEIADLICDLLDTGVVNKVLITGGVANFGGSYYHHKPESESIFSFIPQKKYSDKEIVLEVASKNTLENVTEARKVFAFDQVKSMTFISHSYASTRAALSLKRFFPEVKLYCIPFPLPSDQPEFPVNRQLWSKSKYGQSLVLGEYLRLITYGKRGDFPIESIQALLDQVQDHLKIKDS